MRVRFYALVGALLLSAPSYAASQFVVDVDGLRNAKGQLVICVWGDKAGFPDCAKSKTAVRFVRPVTGTAMRVELPAPASAASQVAISVHHDEDMNGKIKSNLIGMPKEGVGLSNNAGGFPNFGKALVGLTAGGNVPIKIRYL